MTAQAEEVEGIPWSAVFENPEFTKEEIMKETIDDAMNDAQGSPRINDPTYWQRLHSELYTYDIKIESPYTTYSIGAKFLNQTTHTYFSDEQNWTHSPLSMLTNISFEFFFPDRIPVVSIKNINSDEMYTAFRHLSKQNNGPLRVVITVDGSLDTWDYTARLRVENDKESIEIKQFDYRPVSNASRLELVKSNKNLMRYMNYPGKPARP